MNHPISKHYYFIIYLSDLISLLIVITCILVLTLIIPILIQPPPPHPPSLVIVVRCPPTHSISYFSLITAPPSTLPCRSCAPLLPPHRPWPPTHRPVHIPPRRKKTKKKTRRTVKDQSIRTRHRNHPRWARSPCHSPERDDPRPASDTTAPTVPRPSLDLLPYASIPILTRAKGRSNAQRRAVTVNSVFRVTCGVTYAFTAQADPAKETRRSSHLLKKPSGSTNLWQQNPSFGTTRISPCPHQIIHTKPLPSILYLTMLFPIVCSSWGWHQSMLF